MRCFTFLCLLRMCNYMRKRSGLFGAVPWVWCRPSKRWPGQRQARPSAAGPLKHQKDDLVLERGRGGGGGGGLHPTMAPIHLENCASARVTVTKGEGVLRVWQEEAALLKGHRVLMGKRQWEGCRLLESSGYPALPSLIYFSFFLFQIWRRRQRAQPHLIKLPDSVLRYLAQVRGPFLEI